ncbi:hypothetical protein BFS14_12505 [Serratia fonticola]|nr:hypothetical protein BFS14_12505 [Serratia fonticola]
MDIFADATTGITFITHRICSNHATLSLASAGNGHALFKALPRGNEQQNERQTRASPWKTSKLLKQSAWGSRIIMMHQSH